MADVVISYHLYEHLKIYSLTFWLNCLICSCNCLAIKLYIGVVIFCVICIAFIVYFARCIYVAY